MTTQRFMAVLVTVALMLFMVQASNLRNAGDNPTHQVQSGSSSAKLDSIQNSTPSGSSASSIIETQSRVEDAAVGDADGVKAWAQCGGLYYLGDTRCQPHTFCKQLSDFISVCFPESRPTEKVMRLEL
ncbi:hypothetical protein PF005_g3211 [Phytophthora fragariae]|uniref:CBM1 domain-containing protein n=1 Tax=Phytophthora fragariae TaxID=53985 RepID=A0A6A3Z821_9STRA|nr:hypothetical protein PF003_g17541 [Phytophthora fragariae]KAE8947790.1 hypothetical protein PF009_g2618 [Phytophthora fragariae]KAE9028784.1 hypothetical protein PF011_g1405 [Phytophthora fragariae]KAE9133584.1 hypothetical protein PF010_g2756 [Phytophthora fragariae]KAE9133979.1 hypothetical protein PF007_g3135 [Phytophthora fragariae]